MFTYTLPANAKNLIVYLNLALAQRKRLVQQGITQYGEDHPITTTAQQEYAEINACIAELLKANADQKKTK